MAVSAIIATAKYGPVAWKVVTRMVKFISALEALTLLPERVDLLAAQFERNGGSSLRDAVDKTNHSLKQFSDSLEELNLRGRTRWRMDYSVPSWEADAQGRWITANLRLCEMLDVGEEDLTGMNWKNVIHFLDADRVYAAWNRVVLESSHFNISARCVMSCGTMIHVRFKAHAMKLGGRTVGWIGTADVEEPEVTA